jgi:exosortase F-associated protein
MKKIFKYPLLVALFFSLVLVRAFENTLFYDPFIVFFQNDYLYSSIPDFEFGRLFLSLAGRYFLNAVISIGIVYVVFEKVGYVILALKLYFLGFVILAIAYAILLSTGFEKGYLLPFYVRRFIIHPLFLLILLAALFYEKLVGVRPTL